MDALAVTLQSCSADSIYALYRWLEGDIVVDDPAVARSDLEKIIRGIRDSGDLHEDVLLDWIKMARGSPLIYHGFASSPRARWGSKDQYPLYGMRPGGYVEDKPNCTFNSCAFDCIVTALKLLKIDHHNPWLKQHGYHEQGALVEKLLNLCTHDWDKIPPDVMLNIKMEAYDEVLEIMKIPGAYAQFNSALDMWTRMAVQGMRPFAESLETGYLCCQKHRGILDIRTDLIGTRDQGGHVHSNTIQNLLQTWLTTEDADSEDDPCYECKINVEQHTRVWVEDMPEVIFLNFHDRQLDQPSTPTNVGIRFFNTDGLQVGTYRWLWSIVGGNMTGRSTEHNHYRLYHSVTRSLRAVLEYDPSPATGGAIRFLKNEDGDPENRIPEDWACRPAIVALEKVPVGPNEFSYSDWQYRQQGNRPDRASAETARDSARNTVAFIGSVPAGPPNPSSSKAATEQPAAKGDDPSVAQPVAKGDEALVPKAPTQGDGPPVERPATQGDDPLVEKPTIEGEASSVPKPATKGDEPLVKPPATQADDSSAEQPAAASDQPSPAEAEPAADSRAANASSGPDQDPGSADPEKKAFEAKNSNYIFTLLGDAHEKAREKARGEASARELKHPAPNPGSLPGYLRPPPSHAAEEGSLEDELFPGPRAERRLNMYKLN